MGDLQRETFAPGRANHNTHYLIRLLEIRQELLKRYRGCAKGRHVLVMAETLTGAWGARRSELPSHE